MMSFERDFQGELQEKPSKWIGFYSEEAFLQHRFP